MSAKFDILGKLVSATPMTAKTGTEYTAFSIETKDAGVFEFVAFRQTRHHIDGKPMGAMMHIQGDLKSDPYVTATGKTRYGTKFEIRNMGEVHYGDTKPEVRAVNDDAYLAEHGNDIPF